MRPINEPKLDKLVADGVLAAYKVEALYGDECLYLVFPSGHTLTINSSGEGNTELFIEVSDGD